MFSLFNSTRREGRALVTFRQISGLFLIILAIALLQATATAAFGAGNPDRSFGTQGKAITPVSMRAVQWSGASDTSLAIR